MNTQEFIGVSDVSKRTGLSKHHVYKLVELKKIPCYKPFGKKLFFVWEEVAEIIKGNISTDVMSQNISLL